MPDLLNPVDEFYLELCDEARLLARQGAHVGYLRELYPTVSVLPEDQVRVIMRHASAWLRSNLVLADDGRHSLLTAKARRYLKAKEKTIKTLLQSQGAISGPIYVEPLKSTVRYQVETRLMMTHFFEEPKDCALLATSYTAMAFVGPSFEHKGAGKILLKTIRPVGEQIWRDTAPTARPSH